MELQLKEIGTPEFEKFFNVHLGDMPEGPENEASLQSAISKLWSADVEVAFEEGLYLSPLISKNVKALVVEKEDLLSEHRGDTLYINKLAALEPENDGDLGTAKRIYNNETPLEKSRISITPSRRGAGVAWVPKVAHSISYDLRQEVKGLLSNWMSGKIERMLMASANQAPQTLFSGVATSMATLTSTDILLGTDLARAFAVLRSQNAQGVSGLDDYYFGVISPECYLDLLNDASFLAAVTATSSEGKLELKNYVQSYAHIRLFVSTNVPRGITEGSPGCAYDVSFFMGSRALALAWENRWSWKEREEHYGEVAGVMSDAWVESAVLNPNYICKIVSSSTPIGVTTAKT